MQLHYVGSKLNVLKFSFVTFNFSNYEVISRREPRVSAARNYNVSQEVNQQRRYLQQHTAY